jgi:nucleoside 2-deoxyribosyltransferase
MSVILVPVYIAGPDVFYPNAVKNAVKIREVCEKYGVHALIPLDNEVQEASPSVMSKTIFEKNVNLMEASRMTIANLTPFRGPSADAGTVWEVGYTYARNKPVFAHTDELCDYKDRVMVKDGNAIEDFGNVDNLMIDNSIVEIKGNLETVLSSKLFQHYLDVIRQQMVQENKIEAPVVKKVSDSFKLKP